MAWTGWHVGRVHRLVGESSSSSGLIVPTMVHHSPAILSRESYLQSGNRSTYRTAHDLRVAALGDVFRVLIGFSPICAQWGTGAGARGFSPAIRSKARKCVFSA